MTVAIIMRLLGIAAAIAFASASASAQSAGGFRPPATPLLVQSPLTSSWSLTDTLPGSAPTFWTQDEQNLFAAVRVDNAAYALMGVAGVVPEPQPAQQLGVTVWSTQTVYAFAAGGVLINLTFTSPLIAEDLDLLSRPAHYWTASVASGDGSPRAVQLYFDVSGWLVAQDPTALMAWQRVPLPSAGGGATASVTALRIGAANQAPLTSTSMRPSWGFVYLVAEAGTASSQPAALALQYANTTRSAFITTGNLPAGGDAPGSPAPLLPPGPPAPYVPPQVDIDHPQLDLPGYPVDLPSANYSLCEAMCNASAACLAWAYSIPSCGGDGAAAQCWLKGGFPAATGNACRVSGQKAGAPTTSGAPLVAAAVFTFTVPGGSAAPVSRHVTIAVDEIASINWFGEVLPPYWRRDLPVNDSTVLPTDMLTAAHDAYEAVLATCDAFDARNAAMLTAVGGAEYAAVAQLTYRQVWGGTTLAWVPSKASAWAFLAEISSCGAQSCLQTADVVYPAFPQLLYFAPDLLKTMVVTHLEYATNQTDQPYPLPWAPHHLGYWPQADLAYTQQENMPLEETAWNLLAIAAIAQVQGGDVTWLTPYWETAIVPWYDFLATLLPFPGTQLSTDDFDGVLYNASNLAVKGIAAMAAYGYLLEQYTGNATAAEAVYATAARYAQVFVNYSWTGAGSADAHFMIGYAGSQGDGGGPASFAMLYNALWLRLLGFDNLLPNQDGLMAQQKAWYQANAMHQYGLPLNSRKTFTKDDWQTFLAAYYYDNSTSGSMPRPSAFSSSLFDALFRFANETTSRTPLSDWTNTDEATAVGFTNRPVYGAMYAPVLIAYQQQLGLGRTDTDPALQHAAAVFAREHAAAGLA